MENGGHDHRLGVGDAERNGVDVADARAGEDQGVPAFLGFRRRSAVS